MKKHLTGPPPGATRAVSTEASVKVIRVKLIAADGNPPFIMGQVYQALLSAGFDRLAQQFITDAEQHLAEFLPQVMQRYVTLV
jgi:hypothetical protein